jgi:hypothetical protein
VLCCFWRNFECAYTLDGTTHTFAGLAGACWASTGSVCEAKSNAEHQNIERIEGMGLYPIKECAADEANERLTLL